MLLAMLVGGGVVGATLGASHLFRGGHDCVRGRVLWARQARAASRRRGLPIEVVVPAEFGWLLVVKRTLLTSETVHFRLSNGSSADLVSSFERALSSSRPP